jgi:hypothetical protein
MPRPVLWLGGLFSPLAREFREVAYQFRAPFVLDSTETAGTFGLDATPLAEALRATAEALRAGSTRPRT